MARRACVISFIVTFLTVSPVMADEIIGEWCPTGGGRSVMIRDYTDVMFNGQTVKANVDRHHVDFVIPSGERDAGASFSAAQQNDEQIRVTIGSKRTEVWTPCKPVS